MSEPFLEKIIAASERIWGVEDTLSTANAIYVLAGGNGSREAHAADLYNRGIAPHIILCTATRQVQGHAINVTRLVRSHLKSAGVPADAIHVLPGRVRSTRDEAQLVSAYLSKLIADQSPLNTPYRLILVTDPYHSRRTRMTYRRFLRGMPVEVLSSPCESELLVRTDWSPEVRLYFLFIELVKMGYYAVRGRLSI